MKPKGFAFSPLDSETILGHAVRQMGYPSSRALSPDMRGEIEKAVQEGLQLLRPACVMEATPLVRLERDRIVARDLEIRSPRWARLMREAQSPETLVCFVVTTGEALEKAIQDAQERSLFHAYLLDAVGSVLAEGLADQVQRHVSGTFRAEGYQTTARFSPGYCDWELGVGQEALFRFLKPEAVGVRRTPAGMMLPQKSISAALAAARGIPAESPCPFCPKEDCPYRRAAREGARAAPAAGEAPLPGRDTKGAG